MNKYLHVHSTPRTSLSHKPPSTAYLPLITHISHSSPHIPPSITHTIPNTPTTPHPHPSHLFFLIVSSSFFFGLLHSSSFFFFLILSYLFFLLLVSSSIFFILLRSSFFLFFLVLSSYTPQSNPSTPHITCIHT